MRGIDAPAIYRIRVRGELSVDWSDRLAGMRITSGPAQIVTLEGLLADQAALAGVLDALYGLHLSILEVKCLGKKRND